MTGRIRLSRGGTGNFECRMLNVASDDEMAELWHSKHRRLDTTDAFARETESKKRSDRTVEATREIDRKV